MSISMITIDSLNQMDCIAGMKQIPAGSIDLAFADPPRCWPIATPSMQATTPMC